MNVIRTEIPDVLILEPKVFGDSRGFFIESFNARTFAAETGVTVPFVQDNHSRSGRGVFADCTIRSNSRKGNWFGW